MKTITLDDYPGSTGTSLWFWCATQSACLFSWAFIWPRRVKVIRKRINSAPSVSYLIDMRCPRLSQNPSVEKREAEKAIVKLDMQEEFDLDSTKTFKLKLYFNLDFSIFLFNQLCKIRIGPNIYMLSWDYSKMVLFYWLVSAVRPRPTASQRKPFINRVRLFRYHNRGAIDSAESKTVCTLEASL